VKAAQGGRDVVGVDGAGFGVEGSALGLLQAGREGGKRGKQGRQFVPVDDLSLHLVREGPQRKPRMGIGSRHRLGQQFNGLIQRPRHAAEPGEIILSLPGGPHRHDFQDPRDLLLDAVHLGDGHVVRPEIRQGDLVLTLDAEEVVADPVRFVQSGGVDRAESLQLRHRRHTTPRCGGGGLLSPTVVVVGAADQGGPLRVLGHRPVPAEFEEPAQSLRLGGR